MNNKIGESVAIKISDEGVNSSADTLIKACSKIHNFTSYAIKLSSDCTLLKEVDSDIDRVTRK